MRITFENEIVRGVCEDYELTFEKYGNDKATFLLGRISDIEAASCIEDIKIGRFVIIELTNIKVVINYYFTHQDDQYMTFEAPQDDKSSINYHSYKKISRVKLTKITL